jgi:hypothetical protein
MRLDTGKCEIAITGGIEAIAGVPTTQHTAWCRKPTTRGHGQLRSRIGKGDFSKASAPVLLMTQQRGTRLGHRLLTTNSYGWYD